MTLFEKDQKAINQPQRSIVSLALQGRSLGFHSDFRSVADLLVPRIAIEQNETNAEPSTLLPTLQGTDSHKGCTKVLTSTTEN